MRVPSHFLTAAAACLIGAAHGPAAARDRDDAGSPPPPPEAEESTAPPEADADPPPSGAGATNALEPLTVRPVPAAPIVPDSIPDRSESSSGQFFVYGGNLELRGGFAAFAEGLKKSYLQLLAQPDQWSYPIVIQLREASLRRGGRAVRTDIQQFEGGFRVQVTVGLGPDFTRIEFERELLAAIMAEHALRGHADISDQARRELLPPWVTPGVAQALEYRPDERPSGLFEIILRSDRLLDAREVLQARPDKMDSISRAVFEASAGALVLTLLSQPSGQDLFAAMIGRMAARGGSSHDVLARSFPALRSSPESLEKWWALQIAAMAEPSAREFLDARRTEAKLREALTIVFRDEPESSEKPDGADPETAERRKSPWAALLGAFRREKDAPSASEPADSETAADREELPTPDDPAEAEGSPPAAVGLQRIDISRFGDIMHRPDRAEIVQRNRLMLIELSQRALPIYRDLVAQYEAVFERIAIGELRGVPEHIAALARQRAAMAEQAVAIEDYLNWYEATQLGRESGRFEDFFRTLRQFEREPSPRQNDPVSQYLDAIEAEVE